MRVRSVLVYTVLRLLAFLVPFGVLLLFPVFQQVPWLAAVFAALIGLSLSLLFLRRPLERATAGLGAPRERRDAAAEDAAVEDAAIEAEAGPDASATAASAAPDADPAPGAPRP